jgi:hypothetical protein
LEKKMKEYQLGYNDPCRTFYNQQIRSGVAWTPRRVKLVAKSCWNGGWLYRDATGRWWEVEWDQSGLDEPTLVPSLSPAAMQAAWDEVWGAACQVLRPHIQRRAIIASMRR